MANGFAIQTQNGLTPVNNMQSASRLLGSLTLTGASGSATVPAGYNATTCFYYVQTVGQNGAAVQPPVISISGTTLTWNSGVANVTVYVFFFERLSKTVAADPYGFYIAKDDQTIILDTRYKPLIVKASGTSSGTRPRSGFAYTHKITCGVNDIVLTDFNVGDTLGSILYYDGQRQIAHSKETINYIVCDVNAVMPKSAYGLQLFNPVNSELIYDSGVQIVDVSNGLNRRFTDSADLPIDAADNMAAASGGFARTAGSTQPNGSAEVAFGIGAIKRDAADKYSRILYNFSTTTMPFNPGTLAINQNSILSHIIVRKS